MLAKLGEGGSARVFLAQREGIAGFRKLVVLKQLRADRRDATHVGAFLDEARLSARLRHRCIVETHDVFEHQGCPVVLMEYVEGEVLARVWDSADASFGLTVLARVLEGLAYAHSLTGGDGESLDLVHRDVTPANVMVSYDGEVKLLDFGIAKSRLQEHKTQTGLIKGTVSYMSPEAILGEEATPASDLYMVARMMWEVVARRRMFPEMASVSILHAVTGDRLVPLAEVANPSPLLTPALAQVIEKALFFDPAARFPSAEEMLDELHSALPPDTLWSQARIAEHMEASFGKRRLRGRSFVAERTREFDSLVQRRGATFVSEDLEDAPRYDPTGETEGWTQTVASKPSAHQRSVHGATTDTTSASGAEALDVAPSGSRRWRYIGAFAAAAVAFIVVGWTEWRADSSSPDSSAGEVLPAEGTPPHSESTAPALVEVTPTHPAETAPAPTAQSAPNEVELRLEVTPPKASVFVDDERFDPANGPILLPRRDEAYPLRIEADGYESYRQSLTLDRDMALVVALRLRSSSASRQRAIRARSTRSMVRERLPGASIESEEAPPEMEELPRTEQGRGREQASDVRRVDVADPWGGE